MGITDNWTPQMIAGLASVSLKERLQFLLESDGSWPGVAEATGVSLRTLGRIMAAEDYHASPKVCAAIEEAYIESCGDGSSGESYW